MNYADINANAITRWINAGWEWGVPITGEAYARALAGELNVKLTPTKFVPREWFGDIRGKRVLGLASGGGQQMPVFAAHGAICTVLDYTQAQLDSESEVARREGYEINIVRADMSKPLPFADGSFDLIFHPVSNCYIKNVTDVWRECARVLAPGGRLLAGLDNGFNYVFDDAEERAVHTLPFDPLADKAVFDECVANDWGIQFSHTAEEQLRGQIMAGLALRDIYEDVNGEGRLHELNVPTFWATLAVK